MWDGRAPSKQYRELIQRGPLVAYAGEVVPAASTRRPPALSREATEGGVSQVTPTGNHPEDALDQADHSFHPRRGG